MPLHLRDGVDLDGAIQDLETCKVPLQNMRGGVTRIGISPAQDYVATIERIELQLRNYFADYSVWNHIYSDRYWSIRSLTPDSIRPYPLIAGEVDEQLDYIAGSSNR